MPPERSRLMANASKFTSCFIIHVSALGQEAERYVTFDLQSMLDIRMRTRQVSSWGELDVWGIECREVVLMFPEPYFLWHQRRKFLSSKIYTIETLWPGIMASWSQPVHKPHSYHILSVRKGFLLVGRVGSKVLSRSSLLTASKRTFMNSTSWFSTSTLDCSSTLVM